jgi:hypothetical protein
MLTNGGLCDKLNYKLKYNNMEEFKMLKFEFKKTINLEDEDLICILSCAFSGGCNYWGETDWLIKDYKDAREILEKNENFADGICSEDVLLQMLKNGKNIKIIDVEDGDKFLLDYTNLFNGIKQAIDENFWDGDIDSCDAVVADNIIQLGLFGEIVYS